MVDTGPLVAAADRSESQHEACLATLARSDLQPVVSALAIAEASYLIGRRLGSSAEARFLSGLAEWEVEGPTPADLNRASELVEQYADLALGGTDASIIALAERLEATTIVTLDQRHFSVVRPQHVESFELLPG